MIRRRKKCPKMSRKIMSVLLLIGLCLLSACSAEKTAQQNAGAATETPGKRPVATKPVIVKELVSPDKKYTAYIVQNREQSLHLGEGHDFEKSSKIETGLKDFTDLSWAPNSQYFFVGNNDTGKGVIFRIKDANPAFHIDEFKSGPYWAPEGDKACFTVNSRVWTGVGISEGTTDIVVKNLNNELDGVHFAPGTLDYYYIVESWAKDGSLRYSRIARKDNQVLAKLSSEYAHYLWSLDINTGERKKLRAIKDLEYLYFTPSADRRWLSMVKITFSGGEAERGIPTFYNLVTGEKRALGEEYDTWSWRAKWFNDSSRIMLNETTVYDIKTGHVTKFKLPGNVIPLGGIPSLDGTQIALFACKRYDSKESKGEPLILYLLDCRGQVVKTLNTPLLPYYSNNLLMPSVVNFDWMPDGQALVVESWDQEKYSPSLWRVNLNYGEAAKLADNCSSPILAPDGKKIAVLTEENNGKNAGITGINILSLEGTRLHSLHVNDLKLEFFGREKVIWDQQSRSIVAAAHLDKDGTRYKFLVKWDLDSGQSQKIQVDPSVKPLYIEDGNIICVEGDIYS